MTQVMGCGGGSASFLSPPGRRCLQSRAIYGQGGCQRPVRPAGSAPAIDVWPDDGSPQRTISAQGRAYLRALRLPRHAPRAEQTSLPRYFACRSHINNAQSLRSPERAPDTTGPAPSVLGCSSPGVSPHSPAEDWVCLVQASSRRMPGSLAISCRVKMQTVSRGDAGARRGCGWVRSLRASA